MDDYDDSSTEKIVVILVIVCWCKYTVNLQMHIRWPSAFFSGENLHISNGFFMSHFITVLGGKHFIVQRMSSVPHVVLILLPILFDR